MFCWKISVLVIIREKMQPLNSTGAMDEEFTCQALSCCRTVADCLHIPQLQLERGNDLN